MNTARTARTHLPPPGMIWIGSKAHGRYVPEPQYTGLEIDKMLWDSYQAKKYSPPKTEYVSIYPICPWPDEPPRVVGDYIPFHLPLPTPRGADGLHIEERVPFEQRLFDVDGYEIFDKEPSTAY